MEVLYEGYTYMYTTYAGGDIEHNTTVQHIFRGAAYFKDFKITAESSEELKYVYSRCGTHTFIMKD